MTGTTILWLIDAVAAAGLVVALGRDVRRRRARRRYQSGPSGSLAPVIPLRSTGPADPDGIPRGA